MTNPNDINDLPGDDEDAGLEDLEACFVAEPQIEVNAWYDNMRARLSDFVDFIADQHETMTESDWLRAYTAWENEQD